MAPASGTVARSAASRNISKIAIAKSKQNLLSETIVEGDFCAKGFTLLARRQKIKGCEIDLIFYNQQVLVFVEVKAGNYERVIDRWQQSGQRRRQLRVVRHCLERGFKVSWQLSVVDKGQCQHWDLLDMV